MSLDTFSWKQKWLAITPKPFALLSIAGSVYIIKHVLTSSKRRSSVYHRIVLGLSIYDLMTSAAVFVGTWAIPEGTKGVFLAYGTEHTCSVQGFFIQLGVGTPLYNASLALYYVCVIFLGWKQDQLQRIEPLLHLLPIGFSLSTAIVGAATDSYRNSNVWCWTSAKNTGFRMGLFYGPVWASLLTVSLAMSLIYFKVLVQERRVKKYQCTHTILSRATSNVSTSISDDDPTRPSFCKLPVLTAIRLKIPDSASNKFAAQGLFYVLSFYLTFVFPSWTRISQMMTGSSPFAAVALFAVFFPLQGFFNAMVYFRPRYLRYRKANPHGSLCRSLCGLSEALNASYRETQTSSSDSNPDTLNNSIEQHEPNKMTLAKAVKITQALSHRDLANTHRKYDCVQTPTEHQTEEDEDEEIGCMKSADPPRGCLSKSVGALGGMPMAKAALIRQALSFRENTTAKRDLDFVAPPSSCPKVERAVEIDEEEDQA